MDSTFNEFITKAKRLGLCAEYTDKVDSAGSKKALLSICLDANGLPWICHSIARGWGLTPDYISKEFAPFNNGKYTRKKDGYTSQMYCQYDGAEIEVKTTALLLIDVHNVRIVADRICEIYMVNSKVEIVGRSHAIVYSYNSAVTNPDSSPAVVRYNE